MHTPHTRAYGDMRTEARTRARRVSRSEACHRRALPLGIPPAWEIPRAGFLSCCSALFAQVLRRIAEICGDSDLCLKTTRKFCGGLPKTAKCSNISGRPQNMQTIHLNDRRVKLPSWGTLFRRSEEPDVSLHAWHKFQEYLPHRTARAVACRRALHHDVTRLDVM